MKIAILFCLLLGVFSVEGQMNVDSLSHVDYQQLHQANLNDVWGYVDEFGNEYAIVGTSKGTSIVDISTPSNPVEVFWLPGTESIWRDPSVHGDYAYITTEAHDGMLIIDLSPLPQSHNLQTTFYTGPAGNTWQSAHTCFVDENGYAYIFGSNRGNRGAIILDVHTSPMNPIEVGVFDNWYVHDGFVRNDTMYLAHILDGFFSLVDVSDKSNPVLLGTKSTPSYFTHNIWPSNDGSYVFTTDEVSGAFVTSYNIQDPSNIVEVDRIQNSPGTGLIPHNTHVLSHFLVTSYYSDGIIIHDITNPKNIIKVGSYDTYPGQTTWYDGCWGVYPFFPSGTIVAADITQGLFVLKPTYKQAAYLEGIITDSLTGNPIENVQVRVVDSEQIDKSDVNGAYATGRLIEGACFIEFSKPGYYSKIISVNLLTGVVTTQNVQLASLPSFAFSIRVIDSLTGVPLSDVQLLLSASLIDHQGITNVLGQEDFQLFYQEYYKVTVGKWGYETICFYLLLDTSTSPYTVTLNKGYYDEFTFDYGWIASGVASSGLWERGKLNGSNSGSAPLYDADHDCGSKAFVTGNKAVLNPDTDDVDGYVKLVSPTMDLTGYDDPYLNFSKWFYCNHIHVPDDTLKVSISNGQQSVLVHKYGSDSTEFYHWTHQCIRMKDFIEITSAMQVSFEISDNDSTSNITEAGVDIFYISKTNESIVPETPVSHAVIYPNPFTDYLVFEGFDIGSSYTVYSTLGQTVCSGIIEKSNSEQVMHHLAKGLYLIKINGHTYRVLKE